MRIFKAQTFGPDFITFFADLKVQKRLSPTRRRVNLQSPGFPYEYPNSIDCIWHIIATQYPLLIRYIIYTVYKMFYKQDLKMKPEIYFFHLS